MGTWDRRNLVASVGIVATIVGAWLRAADESITRSDFAEAACIELGYIAFFFA